jgi:hypothetical protein
VSADRALRAPQFVDARTGRLWWVRGLNAAGALAPRALAPDARDWERRARKRVPDAGDVAPEVRCALAVLVEALRRDAALSLLGRISARDDTVRLLATHLRVERAFRARPEIARTELPPLVFVIGVPRSGTTFLHRLLAADPASRSLPYWESFDPVPPEGGPDRRAARVDRMMKQLAAISPAYQSIHPMTAADTEECVALFMNVLRTLQMDIQYRVPGYTAWLLGEDARIAYRAYRRQLQLVHSHRPAGRRLVVKDPAHLAHLTTIGELFPDAKFVFTHRDPAFTFSSLCSLYAYTRAIFSDDVDPRAIGREVMAGHWPAALERSEAMRATLPAGSWTDVRHADLARDPLGTAAATYAALGLDFDDAARDGMAAFLAREAARPKHVHEHSPAGFGLVAAAIRERFAPYVGRYGL